jgi:hypothetical protein
MALVLGSISRELDLIIAEVSECPQWRDHMDYIGEVLSYFWEISPNESNTFARKGSEYWLVGTTQTGTTIFIEETVEPEDGRRLLSEVWLLANGQHITSCGPFHIS